ncbi:hypothetical protein DFH07DRAFT_817664 [Mycena maculata]|uniref:Uncharacterized protein n=1 Tax=Mycena maculata TaxID=230809 RepID=A0AAD7J8F5_9AGAR|nr:hypothetical protein DFH07DRAFT_817664 [Mycena maculata]
MASMGLLTFSACSFVSTRVPLTLRATPQFLESFLRSRGQALTSHNHLEAPLHHSYCLEAEPTRPHRAKRKSPRSITPTSSERPMPFHQSTESSTYLGTVVVRGAARSSPLCKHVGPPLFRIGTSARISDGITRQTESHFVCEPPRGRLCNTVPLTDFFHREFA